MPRQHFLDASLVNYELCRVAVDLKISEIVDAPNWIVSAFLPEDVLGVA